MTLDDLINTENHTMRTNQLTTDIPNLRVAMGQMDVVAGAPRKNVQKMYGMIQQAIKDKADVIVFPEMAVGGYMVGDKWNIDEYCEDLMLYDEAIRQMSKDIAIVYGNIHLEQRNDGIHRPNQDGTARKYNATLTFQNGQAAMRMGKTILPDGVQAKTLLPNYRFFDDMRYFFSNRDIAEDLNVTLDDLATPMILKNRAGDKIPVGIETCEDLWADDYRAGGEAISMTKKLVENGAHLIVNLSSSPWTIGKNEARDRHVKKRLEECADMSVPFVYVNNVGAQNNGKNIITFDGGSTVYNKAGEPVILGKSNFQEELVVFDTKKIETLKPLKRVEKKPIAQKYEALIRGIQHVKDTTGSPEQPNYAVAVSGGIDSAVVAALLVDAVGAKRVSGWNYPTKYNSNATKDAARDLCANLNVPYHVIPVEDIAELTKGKIETATNQEMSGYDYGNLMAKVRVGMLHSTIAATQHALYPNCGNKTELLLGYFTLDGDGRGALSPIGDLTKTEVYELASYINEHHGREVIPDEVIHKIRPSAELEEDQFDPIDTTYHSALTAYIMDYKEKTPTDVLTEYHQGTLENTLGLKPGYIKSVPALETPEKFVENLEWFTRQKESTVFKRVQAPNTIITSKKAFGYDLRESMLPYNPTNKYVYVKEKVLEAKK